MRPWPRSSGNADTRHRRLDARSNTAGCPRCPLGRFLVGSQRHATLARGSTAFQGTRVYVCAQYASRKHMLTEEQCTHKLRSSKNSKTCRATFVATAKSMKMPLKTSSRLVQGVTKQLIALQNASRNIALSTTPRASCVPPKRPDMTTRQYSTRQLPV